MRVAWAPGLIVVAAGVGLALLSLPSRVGAVPLAPALSVDGVSFRAVPASVRAADVAHLLHVRLEKDGLLGLRVVTSQKQERVGDVLGVWHFSGEPAVDGRLLTALRRTLADFLSGREAGPQGATVRPATQLLIDAAPEVPWERTSWVIQAAAHHGVMIRRFTFLGQGAGVWCNVSLPQSLSRDFSHDATVQARRLVVRLFRKGLDDPAGQSFTRMRSSVDLGEVGIDPDGFPYELEHDDVGSPNLTMTVLDLPPSPFVPAEHATAWAGLERLLAERGPEPLHYAEVRTPRPIGTLVPTADVIEVLLRLARAGYAPTLLDNPAPPGAGPEDPPTIEDVGR